MRADNSSAIVVFIEKKKMEPKNGGTAAYTEKWTSANKNEHKKEALETPSDSSSSATAPAAATAKPAIDRKPLKEVTPQITPVEPSPVAAKSLIGRKRPSSENNNENNAASTSSSSTAAKKSKLAFTASKVQRRRSTRIAVKRCEHGLTRSAARKRASL